MKIGWLRLNQALELDYWSATGTFVEERMSLIHGLLQNGVDVVLLTPLKSRDFALEKPVFLKNNPVQGDGELIYSPDKYIKCDALIVENGTTNMNFCRPETKKPWMREAVEKIDKHTGKVFWYQSDPLLPFPFAQMTRRMYPWGSKKNGYCGGKRDEGWTTRSGWATEREIFGGKKNIVLVRSNRRKATARAFNGSRSGYWDLMQDGLLDLAEIPMAINFDIRKHLKVRKESLGYGLTYCGGDRSRRPMFRKYYCDNGVPTHCFGKWKFTPYKMQEDDHLDKTGYSENFPGVMFCGPVKHFWEIDEILNRSLFTIQIGTKVAQHLGWMTLRPMEAIADGSIAYGDRHLMGGRGILDTKYLISTKSDVKGVFNELTDQTLSRRRIINEEQRHYIDKLTYKRLARFILALNEGTC